MKKNLNSPSSYDHTISALFHLLFLVLIATLVLSILFYPEPFLFWQHAFSDLGDTISMHGYNNSVSRRIYTTGMIAESLILFKIAFQYKSNPYFRNQTIKHWLAVLGGFGFLISNLPNSRYHTLHSIGTGMVVGALYFFIMFYLFEQKDHISAWHLYTNTALLQLGVFPYAAAFFVNSPHKQSLQKTCIVGIFLVLLNAVSLAEDSFAPGEFFKTDKRVHR